MAKPEDQWTRLAINGIRFLVTVEPVFQHFLAIHEVAPTGFKPVYPDPLRRPERFACTTMLVWMEPDRESDRQHSNMTAPLLAHGSRIGSRVLTWALSGLASLATTSRRPILRPFYLNVECSQQRRVQ